MLRLLVIARTCWRFFCRLSRRYRDDRCHRVAGALSYTTLLALVPLSTIIFVILSVFPAFQAWMATAQEFIYSNFVPTAGTVVREHLNELAQNSTGLTAWSAPFLVITALMLMSSIEKVFNDIWHIKQNRKLLYRMLNYWLILMLAPLLIAGSFTISAFLVAQTIDTDLPFLSSLYWITVKILPWVLELGVFLLLYIVVPNRAINWRHALVGAVVAMLLFEIAKSSFAYFVTNFSNYQVLYGALAALPIFLVWLYITWSIILLGAVITAMIAEWRPGYHSGRED